MPKYSRLLREVLYRDAGEDHGVLWMFFVNTLAGSFLVPARCRTMMYRLAGLQVHKTVLIRPGCIFRSSNVSIGAGTTLGFRCLFDNRAGVTVGANVGIGSDTRFLTADHDMGDPKRRSGAGRWAPIVVGNGCRISTNSIVAAGVILGEGVAVGAGSFVNRDCAAHGLYVGTPVRRAKDLPV